MNNPDRTTINDIGFYLTSEHECSYLPERQAITLFVDPNYDVSMGQYNTLAKLGFRRSGSHIYRPHCNDCGLCIPVRVPVKSFVPSRSQRRNINKNEDITYEIKDAVFQDEHYDLYRRYMQGRHPGGGMDKDEPESYESLIQANWSESKLLEFRLANQIVMVAVVDIFDDGISAVYTYFDPKLSQRGLGVYGILSEIEHVKSLNQDWLYLGYWNPKTNKMSYKTNFQPVDFFDGQHWQRLEPTP